MLAGRYFHLLDSKNRIIIPSKLKDQLGDTITILRGSDKCLTLYSAEEWENYAKLISELPKTQIRAIARYIYSNSVEVQPDSQGRVAIPPELLSFAGITKNVVTLGCGKYAEIWAREVWEESNFDDQPDDYNDMLISLGL